MGLFNWFTQEIAIDLGTANTLIIHNDEVVVNEPSIVALDRNNPKNVLAVGKRALMMHEKTHESIRTVRPLKDGVIADFNAAELMIRELIKLVYPKKPWFPPSWRMMICIPSSITEVEKRAVRDSAEQAGAKEVYLIHEPMAAALGIGIDVEEPVGNMISAVVLPVLQ
jgi:rod shape-determining protein MreB and related proteins